MEWLNEPASWQRTGDVLTVSVDPGTDFWRETGYGYIRDSGHVYGELLEGDLDVSVRIRSALGTQYDQAGVMLRADDRTWLKTGVEFFEGRPRLSTVLTLGRSSWTVTDLPDGADDILLRVARRGDAVEVRYLVGDGQPELAALVFMPPDRAVLAGVMCAAPEGPGFRVSFHGLYVTERDWSAAPADGRDWPDEADEGEAAWAGGEGGASWAGEDDDGLDDPGWARAAAAEDDRDWPAEIARQDAPGWAREGAADDDTGWPEDAAETDDTGWPGAAAADSPAKDGPDAPGDAPADREQARPGAPAERDRPVWASAPTTGDWNRPADKAAAADWERLAAGAQASAQAERWTAQNDADVANEWPGPPLPAAARAAISNGSTAGDGPGPPAGAEPSAPAEPEPLASGPDGESSPGQTEPGLATAAPAEPAPAMGLKPPAARPPVDEPVPLDSADEWISLLTADPAEE